jgi:histidinol-phosphatase
MAYQREWDFARSIARQAGEIALRYYHGGTETEEKPDFSPVTVADRASEQLICRLLAERFPDDGILGEEGTFVPSRSGRRWLIDPIDGTRDFVRRIPFWSVQIALEDRGKIVLGIIYLPGQDEIFHAVEGSGCFWNDTRTEASKIDRLDKAILMVSGFRDAWKTWDPEKIRSLTENCWTVRAYSGCYDVTMIARGKADIWLSGSGMEWDYAPAVVIAQECGAVYLTKDGSRRIDVSNALICAPGLEKELRQIMRIPSVSER